MIGKGATPSFFAIANYNYTLTKPFIYYISDILNLLQNISHFREKPLQNISYFREKLS